MKSLQVRIELESNIVARHGLMIAKMPVENVFVRLKNETVLLGARRAIEHCSSSVNTS